MIATETAALALPRSTSIARAVFDGLASVPKRLPPVLFYDATGSALFERITSLPEYYLTRTEFSILREHASDVAAALEGSVSVIELGAGTATKTGVILDAVLARQRRTAYYPIDISPAALAAAARPLSRPGLSVRPLVGAYEELLPSIARIPGRKLVLFIGSTIGNYEPPEAASLLAGVRRALSAGDALLLGADLPKAPDILLPAYDDPQGVTSAFNKNVLARINRELGGQFDLDAFRHVAIWNKRRWRIEMHLESLVDQRVPIRRAGLTVHLRAGERIHTENSYKLPMQDQTELIDRGGFHSWCRWTDPRGWFAVHLAGVAPARS